MLYLSVVIHHDFILLPYDWGKVFQSRNTSPFHIDDRALDGGDGDDDNANDDDDDGDDYDEEDDNDNGHGEYPKIGR